MLVGAANTNAVATFCLMTGEVGVGIAVVVGSIAIVEAPSPVDNGDGVLVVVDADGGRVLFGFLVLAAFITPLSIASASVVTRPTTKNA